MREIKFRAWFKNKSEMKKVAMNNVHKFKYSYWYLSPLPMNDYEPIELMQYTGLKDKNGREIYEGDVVRGRAYGFNRAPQIVGEVIYDYCEFKVKYVRAGHTMKPELSTVYEIIGNIHEHPHLLEQS